MIDELRHQLHRAADVEVHLDALSAIAEGEWRIRRGVRRRRVVVGAGVLLVVAGVTVLLQVRGGGVAGGDRR